MSTDHHMVYEKIGPFRAGTVITIGGKKSPYDILAYYVAQKSVGFRFTIEDVLTFAKRHNLPLTMPAARRVLYLMKDQIKSTRVKKRSKDPIPHLDYTAEVFPAETGSSIYFWDRALGVLLPLVFWMFLVGLTAFFAWCILGV